MLIWSHEKPHFEFNTCRSQKRAAFSFCPNHSWGLGRNKDCCLVVGNRGAKTGMDKRGLGVDPHEFKSLDSFHESGRFSCASAPISIGPAGSINVQHKEGTCLSLRKKSGRVRFEPCSLGWAHGGGAPKAAVWAKANGEASSALDASVGIPAEARKLCLSSSSGGAGQAVSEGFKKNLRTWAPKKRWSSKTRLVLPCIRAWVAVGLASASGCGWPPPASIESV